MDERLIPGHDGRLGGSAAPRRTEAPTERDRYVTPDGIVLSGWWRRLVAYVADGMLVAIAVQLVLLPMQLSLPGSWLGSIPPDLASDAWGSPLSPAWWYALASLLATVAASAVYSIVMHARLGWTLGKRLTRIRVRHRLHERLPTVREAAVRWAVQLAPAAFATAPWLAAPASIWTTIDGLWPLWDARRQSIHDRAAGTSVVRAD